MLVPDDWKIALEDARHRHAAVVALIYFTDGQAMGLLRLYVTIGVAAGTVAAASLIQIGPVPEIAGWGLTLVTALLAIGASFCFWAMRAARVNLPGRGAEFWLWAADHGVTREDMMRAYLENLKSKHVSNNAVNESSSGALTSAKLCGVAALVVTLGAAIGSALWG